MKKIVSNKLFISGVCLVIAVIVATIILPLIDKRESATIAIIHSKNDIAAGELVTAEMLTTVTVGAYGLPSGTIVDAKELIGKYALSSISPKDNLYVEKFADTQLIQTSIKMSDKEQLITISVSAAGSIGGHIKKGDKVDVLSYTEPSAPTFDPTTGQQITAVQNPDLSAISTLKSIVVYSIQNKSLIDIAVASQSETETPEDIIPAYVTLIVSGAQAQELVALEYGGKVHLVSSALNTQQEG